MDLTALIELMEKTPHASWTATLESAPVVSENSPNTYGYSETVVFFGEGDLHSESWSPFRQGDEVRLVVDGRVYEVESGRIRTFLEPSFTKTYSAPEAKKAGLFEELIAEGKKTFLVEEFGLHKGRAYYLKLERESFHLPPNGPGGKPRMRTNQVLWISDKPYVNGKSPSPLTPAYSHWTY